MKANILYIMIAMILFQACRGKVNESSNTQSSSEEITTTDKMEWWRDARFGMFIHWGLYAIPAGEYKGQRNDRIGEWIMNHMHIPIKVYEKYASQFNPENFDADEWVSILKDAGMKYIVIIL